MKIHKKVITDYYQIKNILLDNNFSVDSPFRSSKILFGNTLMDTEGVEHSKYRKIFAEVLNHTTMKKDKIIEQLDKSILSIFDKSFLNSTNSSLSIDFVKDIANIIPINIVLKLSGLENKNIDEFRRIALDITQFLDYSKINDLKAKTKAKLALERLKIIILTQLNNSFYIPEDTIIAQLIKHSKMNNMITHDFIAQQVSLLIPAALDTTSRLISNMMFLLLNHPEQMRMLNENRDLMTNAINEVLRLEPPIRKTIRFVKENKIIQNKKYNKGDLLELDFYLGNRDNKIFQNPEEFNFINRDNSHKHLSYGNGRHICIGKELANLITNRTFNLLFDFTSSISLLEQTKIIGENFRGVNKMIVEIKK
jgi:pulcherriminic acid synthase